MNIEDTTNRPVPDFNTLKLFKSISNAAENTKGQILSQFSDTFEYNVDDSEDDEDEGISFRRRKRNISLSSEELKQVVSDISIFAEYLKLTPVQTIVFVAYMTGEMLEQRMDDSIGVVKNYLNLDVLDCIPLKKEIKYLTDHGYLTTSYTRRGKLISVDKILFNAIACNSEFIMSEQTPVDRYVFCQKVGALAQNGDLETSLLIDEVCDLEKEHDSLKFVKEVKQIIERSSGDTSDAIIYYCVCNAAADGSRLTVSEVLSAVYSRTSDRIRNSNEFADGTHPLQKMNLVDITPGGFFSDTCLALTEKGRELFMEDDYRSNRKRIKDVIEPNEIKLKELFYDESTTCQIDFLRESLCDKKFVKMQKRLEQKSLTKGVAVLLYGASGTGKTETVLQIARATGRRVMHVDISQSKSCWFGESEKIVKKIFINYKELCKLDKRKPILLFNEADAIFSKRMDVDSSTTSQTMNTIQNIILEEMETLDGILIATTNLSNNIDEAFDRRFLFKIQFKRPSNEAKMLIWKSKLQMLTDDECLKLAENYDLTGGEIDNIIRKTEMNEVVRGEVPSFEYINELCRTERMEGRKGSFSKVGF